MKKIKLLLLLISIVHIAIPANSQIIKSKTEDVKKSALILIETQNEWIHPNGRLYPRLEDKELFEESVKNIESSLAYARKIGMPIIHCGLKYQKGHPELANGKAGLREAIKHLETFPINDFRSQFYETMTPIEGEFITSGRTGSSGFAGSNLDIYLRNNKIETIYLVGYATNVCVESTFREAHDMGYYPVIISDACATFDRAQHDHVFKYIVHHYGETLTTASFEQLYNDEAERKKEEKAITELLTECFLNGALNKMDTEKMRKGFHSDFAILIPTDDGIYRLTLDKWIAIVENYKVNKDKMASGERNVDYRIEVLDIKGNAALAKVQLVRKGELITTDYISFLKYGEQWKAVSKVSNEHIPNPFNI